MEMLVMRKRALHTLAAIALVSVSASVAYAQVTGDIIKDRYIVQLKPGVPAARAGQNHGLAPLHVYGAALNGYAAFIPPGLLRRVAADPQVEAIIPDRVVTINKKPSGGGGGGGTTSQTIPEGVKRIGAAPGATGFTGAGIGVAIVDTGIDLGHADLGTPFDAFSAFGGSAQDDHGHGTHVAGIVAALDNSQDVVGVAPGAQLYAVKVLDAQGSGSDSDIIAGLDWIAANANSVDPPIRVANLSLGRPGTLDDDPALHTAFANVVVSGVTVVVAAGNDCSTEVSQQVPATYPEVIAVASTTAKDGATAYKNIQAPADTASYFTTDGAFDSKTGIGVTISAPGEDQENVLRGYRLSSVGILSLKLGGGTTRMAGTSMAAPHVTGVVALLEQKANGALSSEDVRDTLVGGAQNPKAPLDGITTCYTFDGDREGVLSARGALALVPAAP